MSLAWEVSSEDIVNVMTDHGVQIELDDPRLENIISSLDHNKIEQAALFGDDIDEQTEFANENIKEQLLENGII